jgi:hypothetical protein
VKGGSISMLSLYGFAKNTIHHDIRLAGI